MLIDLSLWGALSASEQALVNEVAALVMLLLDAGSEKMLENDVIKELFDSKLVLKLGPVVGFLANHKLGSFDV